MLKTEIKVLRNLNHKNIVRLYDFNSEENVLILELCFVKLHNQVIYDMRHWSKSSVSRSMSGDLKIFLQVASGLDFLHSCGIIHADIKPDNLLVCGEAENPSIKLADFGLAYSEVVQTIVTHHSSVSGLGTVMYQGPECCDENVSWRTKENDVYALAVTFADILYPERASPYGEAIKGHVNLLVLTRLKSKAVKVPLTPVPSSWSSDAWSIVSSNLDKCMEEFPNNRPTAEELHFSLKEMFTSVISVSLNEC